jgi:tetratricopeptide (TPR) repeat protein
MNPDQTPEQADTSRKSPSQGTTRAGNSDIQQILQDALTQIQSGHLQQAEALCQQVLAQQANHPVALHLLGLLSYQNGDAQRAVELIEQAITAKPDFAEACNNAANIYYVLDQVDNAIAKFRQAIEIAPGFAEAHFNLGTILQSRHSLEDAKRHYQDALVIKPDLDAARESLGEVLRLIAQEAGAQQADADPFAATPSQRQRQAAIDSYNQGVMYEQQGVLDEAISHYQRAVELKPDFAEAHNNLGNALTSRERYKEALVCFLNTLALNPASVHACNNLGNTLTNLDRLDEALAGYERAIAIDPFHPEAYNNRGKTLNDMNRHEEALASYDRALTLKPDYADANFNKGLLKLLLGNYEEGWPLYEWRRQLAQQQKNFARNFSQPLWLGDQSIANKTILLYAEQGLGDVIQFVRYAPMVEALGAKVILELPPTLVPLLRTLKGDIAVIAKGDLLPEFELHCPLMSLPLAFKTTLATIPAEVPYLAVDPHKQHEWRERLGPKLRPRVGLAWSGSDTHKHDRHRSISLRSLAPLLRSDLEFHSLQKEVRPDDQTVLAGFTAIRTHDAYLRDFADTAALVAELDLVVTVDTAVGHLAGALGKEVWILLPYAPDSRWLMQRSDSPWYPTARLFRQSSRGHWEDVIADVCSALQRDLSLKSV